MRAVQETFRHIPGRDLILAGLLSTAVSGGVAASLNATIEASQPPPTGSSDKETTLVVEPNCSYHNPLQSPFITGSHPDIVIKAKSNAINTSQGATLVFTDERTGHSIVAAGSIPPGAPFPESQTHHQYVIGQRPNGYRPDEDMPFQGQRIKLDIVEGNISKDQIADAPVLATVVFDSAKCDERHP